ncbi:hypothetical protein HOE04_03325 [archaeon]|jgi:hypothetical protein|nr:hypothetical protein [archaeon]
MKHKEFWTYFLIGAAVGIIVGLMKDELGIWIAVGSGLGLLIALFIQKKANIKPEKIMWFGFFLLFPIMFFSNQLKPTIWFDVFGILAVIGSFILLINFIKILKTNGKNKKTNK